MSRLPHYIPKNHSNEMPANCIWVDTETKPKKRADGKETHHLWFGWACYQRREHDQVWTKPEWLRFTKIDQFWSWALSKARDKTRLYVFAHNGAFDLPVLHAFSELPERGYKLTNAVVDAPPMILTWKQAKRTIRFIDTLNLWRVPLKALGESVGLSKLNMPPRSAGKKKWDEYGQRDTEIIRQACLSWFGFLVESDLGGFAPTLAAQAFNSYRHRFMPVPIFADNNEVALELAREAYLGGRTEVFKMGEYRGTFYYIDVISMYPSVMHDEKYPHKLVGVYGRPSVKEINKWMHHFAGIYDCIIETNEAIYPLVHEDRLVFPVGKFRCVLAAPEFKVAWAKGHVKHIERVVLYEQDYLFKDFTEYMHSERDKAKAASNKTRSYYLKTMMASLYGKFGQRGRNFETVGDAPLDIINVWDELDYDTQEVMHFREFGGIKQQWIEEGESKHSHPAIAAHVTSYARLKLIDAMHKAGRKNCYYCDTDSLVVNQEGFDKLNIRVGETALGAWELEKVLSHMIIYGAKDYIFDGDKKTKGIRHNADWTSENSVLQDQFVGFKGLLREGNLTAPVVFKLKKTLSRKYTKGRVLKSGVVRPLVIKTAK